MSGTMKNEDKKIKVAIVVDNMLGWGGGMEVLKELLTLYPEATVYTPISDPDFVKRFFPKINLKNSFIQYFPFEKSLRQELYLLYPIAMSLFSFKEYDIVISAGTAFAKFVRPKGKKVKHIHYCYTPPKFFWMKEGRTIKEMKRLSYRFYSFFMDTFLEKIWQNWDRNAASRVDKIVSISHEVASRTEKFWGIKSDVLYPPVDTTSLKFNGDVESRENWYLYLGRVETYKGVDLAIKACIKNHVPLKIAGTGKHLDEMKELVEESNAKGLIKFLGFVSQDQKKDLLFRCKALIFPVKEEDFGIVAVEANAAGAPVIAYRSGGVKETISQKNPKTGVFFNEYSSESLSKVLKEFSNENITADNCRKQASQFDSAIFRYKFRNLVEDVLRGN